MRLLLLLLLICISQSALSDDAADPFARDILILSQWFEGDFDNEEQRWFENDPRSNTNEEDRVIRVHTIHRRVDLPDFGKHVFYVEEYKDNDPEDVIRQRLVIFSSNIENKNIRMQQGFFKDPQMVLGSHQEPTRLSALKKADVTFLDECDVFWRRHAEQFEGAMKPKACVFGKDDERRYSVHNLTLSKNKYWRVDTTFLVANDELFLGYPVDRPIEMRRARPFICDMYFYSQTPGKSQVVQNLSLHDQGGLAQATRDSDNAVFEILMRNKEYPYYESRPDFIYFSIRRSGEQRSIAFSVNDPVSRQLGMRTKEVGAFCRRPGYEFRESPQSFQ